MNNRTVAEQKFISKLNGFIEINLENEHYGISELANDLGMSRSNLLKKVKAVEKITANQYLKQFRLQKAKEMLQKSSLTVSEVSYKTGFSSPSYFNKCFHDFYGYPPGEMGNRGNEDFEQPHPLHLRKKKLIRIISTLFVLIVMALLLFVVIKPFSFQQKELEKTIAVLPFLDDSPEKGSDYIINGLLEEILDKLQEVDELIVKSRTDIEKFRNTNKSTAEIAGELNVNYLLEGSGQVIGDKIKLRIQLIEASSGNHILSKTFAGETKDVFALQEDIAFSIAEELKGVITPEEFKQLRKRPTENLVAYDLYLQGREFLNSASHETNQMLKINLVKRAKRLFERSILLDTTFSRVYAALAHIYIERSDLWTSDDKIHEQLLDSGLLMANKAIIFDENYGWPYRLRGEYYLKKGNIEKAREEYAKVEEITKDSWEDWQQHFTDFWKFSNFGEDFKALENFYKYRYLKPENNIVSSDMLYRVYTHLLNSGYPEVARKYLQKILVISNDSSKYIYFTRNIGLTTGNYKAVLDYALKQLESIPDSGNTWYRNSVFSAFVSNFYLRNFEKSMEYLTQRAEINSFDIDSIANAGVGYLYLKTGNDEKANYHFQKVIKQIQEDLKSNASDSDNFNSNFNLACIFSALNEKEKALKHLEILKERDIVTLRSITQLKNNPMLDNLRNEPEFALILNHQEQKFLSMHNKVGKLMKKYEKG